MNQKYYGKYRGTVLNNVDPELRGRLMLTVPDVLGAIPSSWAEPCVPLAGPTGPPMGVYFVPPIGAGVWVEFEAGNPDYPIWAAAAGARRRTFRRSPRRATRRTRTSSFNRSCNTPS